MEERPAHRRGPSALEFCWTGLVWILRVFLFLLGRGLEGKRVFVMKANQIWQALESQALDDVGFVAGHRFDADVQLLANGLVALSADQQFRNQFFSIAQLGRLCRRFCH